MKRQIHNFSLSFFRRGGVVLLEGAVKKRPVIPEGVDRCPILASDLHRDSQDRQGF
jgi:hypothetical protein